MSVIYIMVAVIVYLVIGFGVLMLTEYYYIKKNQYEYSEGFVFYCILAWPSWILLVVPLSCVVEFIKKLYKKAIDKMIEAKRRKDDQK